MSRLSQDKLLSSSDSLMMHSLSVQRMDSLCPYSSYLWLLHLPLQLVLSQLQTGIRSTIKSDSLISLQAEELPTTIQRVSLDGMEPQQMLPKVQTSTILLHDLIQTSQVVVQRILQKVLISISQMLVLAQLSVSHDHLLTIIVRGYSGSINQTRQLMGISHLRIGILLTPRKMFSHLVLDSLV